jgi:multiple sugar transport system substrate-binding protein
MKEEEVRQAFQRGDALFERNWTYAWSLHQKPGSAVRGKVGVAGLPHFAGHSSFSTLGGWHIGISRYSDCKEKAWKFIRFITSYTAQKKLLLTIGWTPGRKDVYEDEEVKARLPYIEVLVNALQNVAARPRLPYYAQVSEVVQRYVNNCLADKMSARKTLIQIQEEVDTLTRIYEEN